LSGSKVLKPPALPEVHDFFDLAISAAVRTELETDTSATGFLGVRGWTLIWLLLCKGVGPQGSLMTGEGVSAGWSKKRNLASNLENASRLEKKAGSA